MTQTASSSGGTATGVLTYWAVELANGTIGIVQSITKPNTANAVQIQGNLQPTSYGIVPENVGAAINKLPNASRILGANGRGVGILGGNIQGAINNALKNGSGVIYNAHTGTAAAEAALGLFAGGFAAVGSEALGAGAAAAAGDDAADTAAGGSAGTTASSLLGDAKTAGTAVTVAAIWAWLTTPAHWLLILKYIGGAVLLFFGLRELVDGGSK